MSSKWRFNYLFDWHDLTWTNYCDVAKIQNKILELKYSWGTVFQSIYLIYQCTFSLIQWNNCSRRKIAIELFGHKRIICFIERWPQQRQYLQQFPEKQKPGSKAHAQLFIVEHFSRMPINLTGMNWSKMISMISILWADVAITLSATMLLNTRSTADKTLSNSMTCPSNLSTSCWTFLGILASQLIRFFGTVWTSRAMALKTFCTLFWITFISSRRSPNPIFGTLTLIDLMVWSNLR